MANAATTRLDEARQARNLFALLERTAEAPQHAREDAPNDMYRAWIAEQNRKHRDFALCW
jgi:hypothetical protein